MNFDLSQLNKDQTTAVKAKGPILIQAGPGTGKTFTLISRILYLIFNENVNPQNILALTYTKKAAEEMKERLQKHHLMQLPYVSTFHGLAYELLSRKKELNIISEKEKKQIIKNIIEKGKNRDISKKELKEVLLSVSNYKVGRSVRSADIEGPSPSMNPHDDTQMIESLVRNYNQNIREQGLIDYDDLLIKLYDVLNANQLQEGFEYIHIDEFQDTNILQYEIARKIEDKNIFVIGDSNQSIYGFRGALPNIFDTFRSDFPEALTIDLKTNYRSSPQVIKLSSSLLNSPPQRAVKKTGGKTQLIITINEFTEAEWIVNKIDQLVGGTDLLKAGEDHSHIENHNCNFSDFAVIYRTHVFSRVLEKKFLESGIPFQVIGGNSIYEKTEISFIINIMRYSLEPSDEIFEELINSSILEINSKSKRIILNELRKKKDLKALIEHVRRHSLMQSKDINRLNVFNTALTALQKQISKTSPMAFIQLIIIGFNLSNRLEQNNKEQSLQQLQSVLIQFEEKGVEEAVNYFNYLQNREYYDPSVDKVTLMTMHAAKGLEFEHIFICGFEEGVIPHKNAIDTEEEKRLLYVALSRAKKSVYLMQAMKRSKKVVSPSEFMKYLSKDYLETLQDEAIEKVENRKKKWKDKKSQMKLF